MSKIISKEWKKSIFENKGKIILSLVFLIISLVLLILSGNYVDNTNAVSVPDLILSHIPVVNLSFIFEWGIFIVIVVFISYALFYEPKRLHYSLGMLSFFLLVRSGFLILTHLKAPAGAIIIPSTGLLTIFEYTNDLFFSGHAGLPFLGFLIYDNKIIKYFMLSASIILAITALLMHVHYSIDVASAYFITYGTYKIGDRIFGPKSRIK